MVAEEDSDDLRYHALKSLPLSLCRLQEPWKGLLAECTIRWFSALPRRAALGPLPYKGMIGSHDDCIRSMSVLAAQQHMTQRGDTGICSARTQVSPGKCSHYLDLFCRSSEEGKGLAARITALVNETISEEAGVEPDSLSQDDVLALIDSGDSQGGSEGFHWVLDPIDGTRGFVGMRQYAVCLGLINQGKVNTEQQPYAQEHAAFSSHLSNVSVAQGL